jgi:hypothetical protein
LLKVALNTKNQINQQLLYIFLPCSWEVECTLFSSPVPKIHVNYCISWRLSSVNFSHFKLLLRNHWTQLEPKLAGMFLGWSKAFEHFPIGSYVNLCPAVAAILDFRSA